MISLPRAIAHVDADCFFASVELLSRPHLRGKPVLVCNRIDRRGIVLAATYEARPFGIRAGTPVFQAEKLCPQGIFITTHFEEYNVVSMRMMEILQGFSPDVEVCSIDEAYVDLTGLRLLYRSSYAGIAQRMQKKVKELLGITISVGIAPSKMLAKIASDFKKPTGLTIVTQKNREEFLRQIPIANIPGVGRNTQALFEKYNFRTALDIATSDTIVELLGKRGRDLHDELSGISLSKVNRQSSIPQSLSHTRTFPEFSSNKEYIFSFSLELLLSLLRRLRSYNLQASGFDFFIMTKNFKTYREKISLETPSDENKLFTTLFKELFVRRIYVEGLTYRSSGFYLTGLTAKSSEQLSLFDKSAKKPIDQIIDDLYKRFGKNAISPAILLKLPLRSSGVSPIDK